jgi:DEAD/DEAH box helicase domain-containing protein
MDARRILDEFKRQLRYDGQIVYERLIPPRKAQYAGLKPALPRVLTDSLRAQKIPRLYTHQAEAIAAVRRHEHVVVVTATASGKTLCYNLPVLETLLADSTSRALYLFPTKALAQDQADALVEFGLPDVVVGTYDGDTPARRRRAVRDGAHIILTNPDMLHLGILPQHFRWASLFRHLRHVVIDDVHIYRGVFGSNVANIIRRLRRICRLHGSDPVFICTSATIANPQEFAATLLGLPVTVVDADGSPSGPRWFALWNPPIIDLSRAHRRSPYVEATELFTQLLRAGARTIVFTQARKIAELIYRQARRELEDDPDLAGRISAYRAGYLPEERRAIEQRLFRGDLAGVVSTSALELGIDVGSLDAAILVGYPGTIASTWQRAGRAGRGREDALVVLVALEDALDQYLMRHPTYLFARPHEHAVIDPQNPYILAAHLRCAAAEVPLWMQDAELFGPRTEELAQILEGQGELTRRRDRWHWTKPGYPAHGVEVRAASGELFRIVDESRGRLVGTVDAARAFEQVHPGAVYLHQGEAYLVQRLDIARCLASVRPGEVDYYTQPRTTTDLEILRPLLQRAWGETTASFGEVGVTTQVIAFARKRLFGDEVLGEDPLDLPPMRLQTTGLWFPIPASLVAQVQRRGLDLAGGIHAVEHAAIGILPLFAMCDRRDLGGVSYAMYPDLGAPAIFIYEGHPGGVGITEKGYELLDELMAATLQTIEACPCEAGCPSCIQSPKCGNMNEPLDKAAAILLLRRLLGGRGTRPRSESRPRRRPRTRRHAPRPSSP